MKVLIIGSDSYIARHFIDQNSDKFSFNLISRVETGSNNDVLITDLFQIPESLFINTDAVINFAAIVHHPEIKDNFIYDKVNYELAIHNAQKAKKNKVKLFVQMSTIAVYGNSTNISINTVCNPQNYYASSKFKADVKLLQMREDNFRVAIVRPPMVYGGGKAPGNMFRLIKLVDRGIPLPFKGIENKRDFIHVNNLIQYLSNILQKQISGVNIVSDNEPVSTEYLIKMISQSLGKRNSLFKAPSFVLKILRLISPKEYNKLFGTLRIENNFPYEDLIKRFSMMQGIGDMVDWYKKVNK